MKAQGACSQIWAIAWMATTDCTGLDFWQFIFSASECGWTRLSISIITSSTTNKNNIGIWHIMRYCSPVLCISCVHTNLEISTVHISICVVFTYGASLVAQLVKNAGEPSSIPDSGRFPGEGIGYPFQYSWTCLVAQIIKYLPAVWETWVWSLGWENPLEEGIAIHSSILVWRIPKDREVWQATVDGAAKSWTQLNNWTHIYI